MFFFFEPYMKQNILVFEPLKQYEIIVIINDYNNTFLVEFLQVIPT